MMLDDEYDGDPLCLISRIEQYVLNGSYPKATARPCDPCMFRWRYFILDEDNAARKSENGWAQVEEADLPQPTKQTPRTDKY